MKRYGSGIRKTFECKRKPCERFVKIFGENNMLQKIGATRNIRYIKTVGKMI